LKVRIGIVSVALLLAAGWQLDPLQALFSHSYLPHRFCYFASPGLIWTNTVADSVIALSYLAIFAALLFIATRLLAFEDLRPYIWIFIAFATFIIACGATHAMEIVTIWLPIYPFSASVKVLCGIASLLTATLFTRATPELARKIPKVVQLLSRSQQERDEARAALIASERVLAERQRGETAIAAINTRLHHIMDSTSDCILKIGWDWTVLYANRQAIQILPELAIGQSYWDCFPETLGTEIELNMRRTMDERVQTEWENYWPNDVQWYSVRAFPSEGGLSIFFVQVTRQKQLEQALKQEIQRSDQRKMAVQQVNELLNHVLDSTQEGVLLIDTGWTTLYANRPALQVLPDLRLHANFWDCYPDLVGSPQETHLRTAMTERVQTTWTHYYEPYGKWFEGYCYPAPLGISLFFCDVSERRTLQEELELERALREKRIVALSNMAGGLAHEISNPLAIIHGTASDLERQARQAAGAPAVDVLAASTLIVNTADRAIRILRGLRGFARDASQDPMDYAFVEDILEQAVQLQEGRFARDNIRLESLAESDLPRILCREIQIGQIVTNLLNNAYDAIAGDKAEQNCAERWVRIEACRAGDQVRIDISDSGHGISEQARSRLMEPFFTTKSNGLGMGVGLSLSLAIAREHGGSLELRRETPCTCFRLLLPIEPETGPTDRQTPASEEEATQ